MEMGKLNTSSALISKENSRKGMVHLVKTIGDTLVSCADHLIFVLKNMHRASCAERRDPVL